MWADRRMTDPVGTAPRNETDEARAIAALLRKDASGLEALVRLHQARAVRLAYAVIGDRAAAEDVVSDAFVKVFDKIHQYDARRPFRPWFDRIVVNGARKALRRRRLERRTQALGDPKALVDDASLADRAIASDQQRAVIDAIRMLPEAERLVVALRYYLDMNEREMSETLGWPAGTVKRRLYNARAHLRDRLTPVLRGDDESRNREEVECLPTTRKSTTF
jgi:RNA polymerase sigma factor (sigma-70 family)